MERTGGKGVPVAVVEVEEADRDGEEPLTLATEARKRPKDRKRSNMNPVQG